MQQGLVEGLEALAAAVNIMAVGATPSGGWSQPAAGQAAPGSSPAAQAQAEQGSRASASGTPAAPQGVPQTPQSSLLQGARSLNPYSASTTSSMLSADKQGTGGSSTDQLKQLLREGRVKLKMDSFDPSLLPKIVRHFLCAGAPTSPSSPMAGVAM